MLSSFDKKFAMSMVKVVLLARRLFIFILFCREDSNGNKNPKPKKSISNVLRYLFWTSSWKFILDIQSQMSNSNMYYRASYLYSCVFMGPLFSSLFFVSFCLALSKTHGFFILKNWNFLLLWKLSLISWFNHWSPFLYWRMPHCLRVCFT